MRRNKRRITDNNLHGMILKVVCYVPRSTRFLFFTAN